MHREDIKEYPQEIELVLHLGCTIYWHNFVTAIFKVKKGIRNN